MEKSFLSFQSSYPTWESDSLGKQFLSNLRTFRDQKLQEINARHSSSSPSRPWRETPIHRPGHIDNNNSVLYRDVPRNPRNHVDSMWLIDSDQRSHPYLLDWYYTCQPHNRTNHHQPILTSNQNPVDDCWPPNLGVRGEDMVASTSGQFFSESSILRHHHQPDGDHPHPPLDDGRSQWWGRGDRPHNNGATLPATANSFIEPPDFMNPYTTRNLLDNSWGGRSIQEEEEEDLDWEEDARRKLSRTTFMDDEDGDIEAGIDLHFDDVYSSRPTHETSTSSTPH